jgi:hypothetical protein
LYEQLIVNHLPAMMNPSLRFYQFCHSLCVASKSILPLCNAEKRNYDCI